MELKETKIAVVGMGYVGIPVAALLADAGYDVTGIQRRSERSAWKIDWLNEGRCPILGIEPELPEMLRRVVQSGRFRVTSDYDEVAGVDVVLIDVQTETDDRHIPRYEPLKDACHSIGKALRAGMVVIVESTVAPGTTEFLVKPILEEESGLKAGLPNGFGLCFAYERVMVGRLLHNIREYPKIVGGVDQRSAEVAKRLYTSIVKAGVHTTDLVTAEVSKTVENAYRDVQIAFANEVALLCESFGTDVYDVRAFVNGLPNDMSVPHANPVRNMHLPGAGVGGHCLPKDTWLLMYGYSEYTSHKNDYPSSVLTDARRLNDWMPMHMIDLLESALREAKKKLKGCRICVLGFAFLENSDDPRNTPAVPLVEELERRGAAYSIHDPFVRGHDRYRIESNLSTALKGSDALVLMTKHDIYRSIDPDMLTGLLRSKVVVDGRNLFDGKEFIAAGFVFRGVGKGNLLRGKEELT